MSPSTTSVVPLGSYRNETPYPFCPGCGHGPILDHLNAALTRLELDPANVVLVSDIGCSGLSDQYFATSAFHGLHGRSITYASGIKLARPELTVIVLMGDGGTGIGGTHLLSAARRNLGIAVLVFNNFNFGMTGGQHSATTPSGAATATTPAGNLERPLDVCATVAANGAGYVYRGTSFDRDLAEHMAEAIRHPGFGLVDVWELCTAYFAPRNRWSRSSLQTTLDELGFETGLIRRQATREFAAAYREACEPLRGEPALPHEPLAPRFGSDLERPFRLVLAGSAGGRVASAARLAARGALLSGLWAAGRTDYPVTVQSGHSVAELILSPVEIRDAGVRQPDALAILSADGLAKSGRYLSRMGEASTVFAIPELAQLETRAAIRIIDPSRLPRRVARDGLATACAAAMVRRLGLFPAEALEEATRLEPEDRRQELAEAVAAGGILESPQTGT